MTTVTHLLREFDDEARESNRTAIAATGTHDLRVAMQGIDTPAMTAQFSKPDRDKMRADINSELVKRETIIAEFSADSEPQLRNHLDTARRSVAVNSGKRVQAYGTAVYPGTIVVLANEELQRRALERRPAVVRRSQAIDDVLGLGGWSSNLEETDDEFFKPTEVTRVPPPKRRQRPRFQSALIRRDMGEIEESVPVEKYGTDEYE